MKIEIKNISKAFGSLEANSKINISVNNGIHALIGENGAGKSTLVKIISGQLKPDKGQVLINDEPYELGSPKISISKGVGLLNQDPLDFGNLSVFESFIVGTIEKNPYRNIDKSKNSILGLFRKYNIEINLNAKTKSLSIGERQQVELIRLLYNGAKLIILDEPTSAFSLEQKSMMFSTLRSLSSDGIVIIFVSHKLDEIIELCDSGTILREGRVIGAITKPFDSKQIINKMFENQSFNPMVIKESITNSNFTINVSKNDMIDPENQINKYNFSFGSIIGIAGLQGSSNDSYIQNFFTRDFSKTNIFLETNKNILQKTFYYMPADRLERGLFTDLNLLEHFGLYEASKSQIINWKEIRVITEKKISEYNIKGNYNTNVNELSGGNQQRLMLSLMPEEQSILLLEQPTRGLDLNSAQSVWEMILLRKKKDIAIMFSSTDMDEIWDYSDIVISVSGKHIMNIDYKKNLTKEKIINYVSGIH